MISTCEELSFPYRRQAKLAASPDKLAKEHGVTIIGTGVTPGFLMEIWPLTMTGICQTARKLKVVRIQNAALRRIPFQRKIGAGMESQEFARLIELKVVGHVGLGESIAMVAAGLGWELDDITESIEPVIAAGQVACNPIVVKKGQVAGLRQIGSGWQKGKEAITLDFQAHLSAPESYDAVYITGIPNMEVKIQGGIHGDVATAAAVVNAIPRVAHAPPGLSTMKDLPITCAA